MADKNTSKSSPIHLTSDDIITKYKLAADIAQRTLTAVISLCVAGAKIVDICNAGDKHILAETSQLYKTDKQMVKGIGFPTSIAVNNIVGNYSPMLDNTTTLAEGDTVKIDLGVTIDGYVAMVAHTIVVGTENHAPVVTAAYTAAQVVARLLKAGSTNDAITEAITKVAAEYNVKPVVGVLSHNVIRFRCDGDKAICQIEEPDRKAHRISFEAGEAYIIDIVFSSGEGKPIVSDEKTTVYKRDPTKKQTMKMKASQQLMQQIDKNFPCFPFTLRAFDAKTAAFGVVECNRAGLVEPYPVLIEKKQDIVSQFKFTALLLPDGTTQVITGGPALEAKSEHYASLLGEPLNKTF